MSTKFGNKEEEVDPSSLFVSETDSKGIITYANKTFLNIAGYSKEELLGKPHNTIRHPFMPKTIFEDLWKTIQKGDTWDEIIINQTKSGGYYWVKANVFKSKNPDGSVKYISVRIKASEQEIEDAIKKYTALQGN
jgi:aerotaxis receptor